MPGPQDILKIMAMKNQFEGNHPKMVSFFKDMATKGVKEGTVIEITVTDPDGNPTTASMKVQASDVEMIEQLKNLR
ncbi:MAG: hypothetical protein K6E19_00130 [Lachnospiraceae bacterium]|nr:hypothetical protein [Lachnospiraceae bacterium]